MTEYSRDALNLRKMSMNNIEFEKKTDNIFLILTVLIMLFFLIFMDFFKNPDLWLDILRLFLVGIVFFVKVLFKREKALFTGEIDLEVKRDDFYFYKNGEMKLELLYKDTDVKYRKTLLNDIKITAYNSGELYYFYVKKDHDTSGYEKLYSYLERRDCHKRISVFKEVIFYTVVFGITAAGSYTLVRVKPA